MESKKPSRCIVIKVGSQVLCDEQGELNQPVLARLASQVAQLVQSGWQAVLVSSGAVASGAGVMNSEPGAARLRGISNPVTRKQALAAAGQVRLMETWRQHFLQHQLTVAQVLASRNDFQARRHYLNMRACIQALLHCGVVPIVNENDVVAVTELMFTDNDELAGLIAGMLNAQLLCLLSTVPGVYERGEHGPADCISHWDDTQHEVEEIVRLGTSTFGRGGMNSKINTARKAAQLGTETVIADGRAEGILLQLAAGEPVGTRFTAGGSATSAKRWLAGAASAGNGSVVVNAGAQAALLDRAMLASLLPVGIERVNGPFERGDVIHIHAPDGRVLGCGRAHYDHVEADRLKGQRGHKPLIHYDYLYLESLDRSRAGAGANGER